MCACLAALQGGQAGAIVTYRVATGVSTRDRQTMELGLTLLCHELRTHCGPRWMPRGVQLCHDRPPNMDSHQRCFSREPSFNQDRNALWLEVATLGTPLAVDPGPALAMRKAILVGRVDDAQGVVAKVDDVMRPLLPFSACSRKHVARLADLSQRNQQRRLADAGTSFQQLRDRVCADIALKYLRQPSPRAAQIGKMLGYSEPAVFTRTFQRQHGFKPRQARGQAAPRK